jgi:L-fuculose-phosphate aldolase
MTAQEMSSSTAYFDETEMREALCEIGRRIWMREYVASNDGNFSVRLAEDRVLCTPTMVSKGFMKPADLPVITMEGRQLSGRLPMTSEIKAHLEIMRHRPDVRAIVHAHPPNATAFAVAREPVPKCVLPEIEMFIGELPMTPYATPGTRDFAESLVPFLRHHNAFLLASHGALTVGADPFEAYYRMETIEQYCRILILAKQIGGWTQIAPERVLDLLLIREKLGWPDRRVTQGADLCSPGVPPAGADCAGDMQALIAEVVRRVLERLGRLPPGPREPGP